MQVVAFIGWLALVALSSLVLAAELERIGARLHLSEALQGIISALGANAPEIATAVSSLALGRHDLGVGVVLGSNIFNLALLLGGSALVAGDVRVRPRGFALNALAATLVTAIATVVVLQLIPAWLGLVLVTTLFVPYVVIAALGMERLARMRLPAPLDRWLTAASDDATRDERKDRRPRAATPIDMLAVIPALAAVVIGSVHMVHIAIRLSARWSLPQAVVGVLLLAALTGIPNAVAAIRLARKHRGAAVVSEAFNSNSFNVLFGICLPGTILGMGTLSLRSELAALWLGAMTLTAVMLVGWRHRLRRTGAGVLVALYGGFVILILTLGGGA